MLLVDAAHEGGRGREDLVDKDEDGLFGRELDALANNIDELADGEVRGDEVFLLVDGGNVALLDLFADDGDAIGVLLANTLGFGLALLKGVLVLELAAHFDDF